LYAIANPENKDKLLAAIREELDRIRESGITPEELSRAKASYLQAERIRRSGDPFLASELVNSMFNNRTMQYQSDHERQIAETTVESVNEALKKYIQPDQLVTVIAGDFAGKTK
jgi:zinc protease